VKRSLRSGNFASEGSRICFVQRSSDSLRDMAADERQSTMSYNLARWTDRDRNTKDTKGTKKTEARDWNAA
jgi:hypothetical protein